MHLKGPDLDLKRLAVAADQCGVQRLVHIRLRHGNIVLEPARDRLVQLMDNTQGSVTVLYRIYNDAHCKQIINLIQRLVLVDHLSVDAEEMLHASVNLGLNAGLLHVGGNLINNALDKLLPGILTKGNLFRQVIVDIWLQIF